jgi:hypothetical protein
MRFILKSQITFKICLIELITCCPVTSKPISFGKLRKYWTVTDTWSVYRVHNGLVQVAVVVIVQLKKFDCRNDQQ